MKAKIEEANADPDVLLRNEVLLDASDTSGSSSAFTSNCSTPREQLPPLDYVHDRDGKKYRKLHLGAPLHQLPEDAPWNGTLYAIWRVGDKAAHQTKPGLYRSHAVVSRAMCNQTDSGDEPLLSHRKFKGGENGRKIERTANVVRAITCKNQQISELNNCGKIILRRP